MQPEPPPMPEGLPKGKPAISPHHLKEIAELSKIYLQRSDETIEFSEKDFFSSLWALYELSRKKGKRMKKKHAEKIKAIAVMAGLAYANQTLTAHEEGQGGAIKEGNQNLRIPQQDAESINHYQFRQKNGPIEVTLEDGTKKTIYLPDINIEVKFDDLFRRVSAASNLQASFNQNNHISPSSIELQSFFVYDKKQQGQQNQQQGFCEIHDNLQIFVAELGHRMGTLMLEGNFKAAYELGSMSRKAFLSLLGDVQKALQISAPSVVNELENRIIEVGKGIASLELALELLISTYCEGYIPKTKQPISLFQSYLDIPKESLIMYIGEQAYNNIGLYLNDYEKMQKDFIPSYSEVCQSGNKKYFEIAEGQLADLKNDILLARTADERELANLSDKWGVSSQSRFEIVSNLLLRYSTGMQYYQLSALVDMGSEGLNSIEPYNQLDESDKITIARQYRGMLDDAKAVLEEQANMISRYALYARLSENESKRFKMLNKGGSPQEKQEHLSYIGLVSCLSNILPDWTFDSLLSKPSIIRDAIVLSNLKDISNFESLFKDCGVEIRRDVVGLCEEAFYVIRGISDVIDIVDDFEHEHYSRKKFKEELAGRYGAVMRDIETGEAWQTFQKTINELISNRNASADEFFDAAGTLANNYGKTGLLLASVALNFVPHPKAKLASKIIMSAIAVWDAYDGNYMGAATMLLGIYGANIPRIGRTLQTAAIVKMTYDGAVGAFEALSNIQKYGASANEAFDAANAVLLGLILPTYHGYVHINQFRQMAEFIRNIRTNEKAFAEPSPYALGIVPNSLLCLPSFRKLAPQNQNQNVNRIYDAAMQNPQMKTIIVACSRKLGLEGALKLRDGMTLTDVENFIKMDPATREIITNEILIQIKRANTQQKSYEYMKTKADLFSMITAENAVFADSNQIYDAAMQNPQMRTIIVACSRNLGLEKALELRNSMTRADVENFIRMDPVARELIASNIINKVNKWIDYSHTKVELFNMLFDKKAPPTPADNAPIRADAQKIVEGNPVVANASGKISFGRRSPNNPNRPDIEISDESVSPDHGYAVFENGSWKYTNTSENGTILVPKDLQPRKLSKGQFWYLQDGDVLIIGKNNGYKFEGNKIIPIELDLPKPPSTSIDLFDFYENYKNVKSVRLSDGRIVQYNGGESSFGPKVHITLPTLDRAQHFELAKTVFDRLMDISKNTVGFTFKFMVSFGNYRLSHEQFGKDFTLYFNSIEDYNAVLPSLMKLSNDLVRFGGDETVFKARMVANGACPLKYNMANEIPVAPYITTSIRAHYGDEILVPIDKARSIPGFDRISIPSNIQKENNFYVFTDNFLREYASRQFNEFLWNAYSQGLAIYRPRRVGFFNKE